jgi:hypothetical protein
MSPDAKTALIEATGLTKTDPEFVPHFEKGIKLKGKTVEEWLIDNILLTVKAHPDTGKPIVFLNFTKTFEEDALHYMYARKGGFDVITTREYDEKHAAADTSAVPIQS